MILFLTGCAFLAGTASEAIPTAQATNESEFGEMLEAKIAATELANLRTENAKLKAENEQLSTQLSAARTGAAYDKEKANEKIYALEQVTLKYIELTGQRRDTFVVCTYKSDGIEVKAEVVKTLDDCKEDGSYSVDVHDWTVTYDANHKPRFTDDIVYE